VDLCVLMEELGTSPHPSRSSGPRCLAAPVLEAMGSELVGPVLSGEQTATLALAGPEGLWALNDGPYKSFVPDAEIADLVLRIDGRGAVVLLEDPEWVPAGDDRSQPAAVRREDRPARRRPSACCPTAPWTSVLARATVALAAEQVGTARRLFGMALDYAKHRIQFDVPIGSFKPCQHKLADMSLDVERAWSAAYYSAMTLDADDADQLRAVHVAKAAAGEAAKRAAKDGIQIHGGIGYTWEHDLHLFMRRAFGTEALLGTTGWHHDRLGDLLMAGCT